MSQPGGYGQPDPQQQPSYGQQPNYGQQPGYGAPGGYGLQEHPKAQTVFILGIIGIFTGVCAWIAWYMGGQAKKEIAAGAPYVFDGNLKTGYLLGKIFGILAIVGVVLSIVYVIAVIALFGSMAAYN